MAQQTQTTVFAAIFADATTFVLPGLTRQQVAEVMQKFSQNMSGGLLSIPRCSLQPMYDKRVIFEVKIDGTICLADDLTRDDLPALRQGLAELYNRIKNYGTRYIGPPIPVI